MDTFLTAWLPNIVCSVFFGMVGWLVGRRSARNSNERAETQLRILRTLAVAAEESGALKLARDKEGNITGGRTIELSGTATMRFGATAKLTTAPASLTGSGAVTPVGAASTGSQGATTTPSP